MKVSPVKEGEIMKVKSLFVSILVLLLFAAPAMADPVCTATAKINPDNQTVPEAGMVNGVMTPTTVTLNGQASDPKPNKGGTYSWVQLSGPAVTLINPTDTKPTFSAPSVGPAGATLTFQLTVTGCTPMQTSTATTTVNVTNVNSAPVASATVSPYPFALEGEMVTLDGRSSFDPDNDALTYLWTQLPGGTPVALSGSGAVVTFIAPNDAYPSGESLTFRLTVSDGALSSSTDKIVNITWVNDPPHAAIVCPLSVNEGELVNLNSTGSSDSDNGIASYAWSQTLGVPNADLSAIDLTTPAISFMAPQLGPTYDTMFFKLIVTDNGTPGLQDSAECSIKVLDVTPPEFSGIDDITAEASSASGATVTFTPTANDAVDGDVTVTCGPISGSTFVLDATTTVNCSAADLKGNTANISFTVTVQDTTKPSLTLPADITAEATSAAGAVVTFTAAATDAVGPITIECVPVSGATFALGTSSVTCTATDGHSNSTSGSFSVTVQDTTPPVIAAHGDEIAEATGPSGAVVTYTSPTTADAVDGIGTATCAPASGSTFALGDTTVTCNATDKAGNAAIPTTFKVTVKDTTPPVIAAHGDETAEATGPSGAVVNYTSPATSDAVDGAGTATCLPASGGTFALGKTTVTCNATDAANNKAIATTFAVHVVDTTPPALSLPSPITAEATGPSGAAVSFTVTAVDLVSGNVTVTCTPASGSTFALGTTTVKCNASDAAGNIANGSFTVTVVDTTPPTISSVPANITAEATGPSGAPVTYTNPTATDLVDGVVAVSCVPGSGSTFALGTTIVTCSASDTRGNTAAKSFTVKVQDTTPPTITFVGSIGAGDSFYFGSVPAAPTCTASDLVSGSVSCSVSGYSTLVGSHTLTATATDGAGNTATSARTYTVMSWTLNGFYQPVDMNGVYNMVKNGSTVPLKFEVFAGSTELMDITVVKSLTYAQTTSDANAITDDIETVATGGTVLRYDTTAGQYIYNWKTPSTAGKCYRVTMTTQDGSSRIAFFKLK
ncbi:MAG: HYR domain-containing protein [Nitrospirae bacterium]|nr:HYR domain-containing protein [Nitrospirota bacterium]